MLAKGRKACLVPLKVSSSSMTKDHKVKALSIASLDRGGVSGTEVASQRPPNHQRYPKSLRRSLTFFASSGSRSTGAGPFMVLAGSQCCTG